MTRRQLLKVGAIGSAAAILAGTYAYTIEPWWVEYTSVRMPIKNLPSDLHGKTIMQISDIHVGNRFDYQHIIDAFAHAESLQPDIVVYTGDYVTYDNAEQKTQLQKVMQHAPLGRLGSVAILGNHDYGRNWAEKSVADDISAILESAKVKILRNTTHDIEGLRIVGLEDLWGPNFTIDAVSQISDTPSHLVLCHNPDACDLDIWTDYEGWILSGHTHGGQVKPPFLSPPMLPVKNKKYSAGHIQLDERRQLYINRALGHLWQVRFNVRPEITLFEMVLA